MPSFVLHVLLGVALFAVYLVAAVGLCWALFRDRRNPSSYTRQPDVLAAWHAMSTAGQEAVDEAALDEAEQAEIDARQDAAEAAGFLAQRAQANALFHP